MIVLATVLSAGTTLDGLAAAAGDTAVSAMMERARFWESRNRLDLAGEALDKLIRMAPDHPDALALLAEVEVRSGQLERAQQHLNRLRAVQPDHFGVARVQTLLRLGGEDKNKLRAARLLAKTGKTEAAVAALRALYPNGPPSGELALEYWQLVASTPNGWQAARDGLAKLVQEYPDNLHYRLALWQHEAWKISFTREKLRSVIQLTRMPAYARQAQAVWRKVMVRLHAVPASIPLLREYLAQNPGDTAVQDRLAEIIKTVDDRRRSPAQSASRSKAKAETEHPLLADPASRAKLEGLALLDSGDLARAELLFQQSLLKRPNDADVIGSMGLIRLREGRHHEAQIYFLLALQLDPGNRSKWTSLARTARFWGLLRESDGARAARELQLAEQKVREALAVDPREIAGVIALAQLQADQGRLNEAQDTYQQALELAPDNPSALRGMISLHLSRGDRNGAEHLIANLAPAQQKALEDYLPSIRAGMLREDADRLVSSARLGQAVATLTQAMQLDVANAWLRYDLAQLYARQGNAARGRLLLEDQVHERPNDADSLHALALFLSGQDERLAAMTILERIPEAQRTDSMTRLQRRLWTGVQMQRAQALTKAGMTAAATNILVQIESAVRGDPDLTTSVAFAWWDLGELERARQLLHDLKTEKTAPAAWRLRYAELLDKSDADADLPALLDDIAASPALTAADIQSLRELRESISLRNAETLRNEGKLQAALETLRSVLATDPGRPHVLYAEASVLRAMNRPREAQASYRRILTLNPSDDDAYLALIDSSIEAGNTVAARRMIDERLWLLAGQHSGEVDTQVKLAGILIQFKEYDRARRQLEVVLAVAPDHSRALAYLSDLARRRGRADLALAYLQRSVAAEASARAKRGPAPELSRLVRVPPLQASAGTPQWPSGNLARLVIEPASPETIAAERTSGGTFRTLAELLDENTAWVSTALDWRMRSGNGGTSELDAKEIPVGLKMPWRDGSRLFFRTDFASVSAGTLYLSDQAQARTFGTLLLCQPGCATGSVSPSGTGVSLTAGYERQGLRIDLGTTPLGFLVQSLVGGVLYKADLGRFSYAIDASRRPITNTQLSYAGTCDPRTGAVWGGVRATGVRLGLSDDQGGALGAWSSLGFHRLTGENVETNNRMQFMAGAYWRVVNQEDRVLSIGVAGMFWSFQQNAGEYTFGDGGYYSPQSYESGTLSLSFGQRTSRFSYLLRGTTSISRSRFDPAPFYPTSPSLQAQAEALSSSNGVDPHYYGGGYGNGYSLSGSFEYQLGPSLFAGARLTIERAPYYAPNRALSYLRYAVNQVAARPVFLPPEPMMPTSEF